MVSLNLPFSFLSELATKLDWNLKSVYLTLPQKPGFMLIGRDISIDILDRAISYLKSNVRYPSRKLSLDYLLYPDDKINDACSRISQALVFARPNDIKYVDQI